MRRVNDDTVTGCAVLVALTLVIVGAILATESVAVGMLVLGVLLLWGLGR